MENPKHDARCRGDVDNQLANLYLKIRSHYYRKYWKPCLKMTGFTFENPFQNVLIQDDVLDPVFVDTVRKFVQEIPFDINSSLLDNKTNPPRSNIFYDLNDRKKTCEALDRPSIDPSKWIWENYSGDIWRATPLTLEVFIGSPIYELIQKLEGKWIKTFMNKSKISLEPVTWVIQRIPCGHDIGPHNDEWGGRKVAFVFYLTPEDWDEKIDGGCLVVEGYRFNPKFNSMIGWFLKGFPDSENTGSPLHWVDEVRAPNSKPRISLVGFLS